LFEDSLAFTFEADNLFRKNRDSRLNAGARYFMTPHFAVDMAARDVWAADTKRDPREPERIIRLIYTGSF
jgi:hypothetical protein